MSMSMDSAMWKIVCLDVHGLRSGHVRGHVFLPVYGHVHGHVHGHIDRHVHRNINGHVYVQTLDKGTPPTVMSGLSQYLAQPLHFLRLSVQSLALHSAAHA